MTARRRCVGAIFLTGFAGLPAAAEDYTVLRLEASVDGVTWHDTVQLPAEGGRVVFRASASFVSDSGTVPIGFAGLTWQPTLSNWRAGSDQLLPWADRGANTSGGAVADVPGLDGPFGRIIPFAAAGPTSSDPYRGHINLVDGSRYLRLARSSITNWVGEGATTGTNAFNNFNGSGGLYTWQKSWANVSDLDPRFAAEITDRLLLKLGMDLAGVGGRTMVFDAPQDGMSRNSTTGQREASWFASQTDNFGQIKTPVVVVPATVTIVPAPGAAALLVFGGVFARRVRRGHRP